MQGDACLRAVAFFALLLAATVSDCRTRTIPDSICLLTAALGLFFFHPTRLSGMLAALPLLVAAMLREDSVGGGDIKFTAAAGLVLGFWKGLWGLALGLALALLFHGANSLFLCLRGMKPRPICQAALPLAPFLSVGFTVLYLSDAGSVLQ